MVVAESSDESMRMGVPGFAKAIASLEMENGGKHEDNVCCGMLVQQADQSMLKSNMLGQLRPIQCWRRRRPLPEFPHVALWREVSILGSTCGTSRARVLKVLAAISISPRVWTYVPPVFASPAEVERRIWAGRLLRLSS